MRALERLFPGTSAGTVLRKVLLDQTVAAPVVNSVFYTGLSFLDGKDDMFQDWREKFLNTYRTGLMYWPFVQFLNFVLVPPFLRTIFTGCCGFLWATFLCFSQQNGDGTVSVALAWFLGPQQIEQVPEDNEVK
ncbi:mpv17-like protein isoform X1 [Arapaima gigas]